MEKLKDIELRKSSNLDILQLLGNKKATPWVILILKIPKIVFRFKFVLLKSLIK